MLLRFFSLIIILACSQIAHSNDFVWYNGKQAIAYAVPPTTSPVVKIALDMFVGDMQQVTGILPKQTSPTQANIQIIQLDKASKKLCNELRKLEIPVDELSTKKEGFYIAVISKHTAQQLYVIGSDGRGTAYGILELSRLAGVSPWVWWGDVTPKKQPQLQDPPKPVSRISRHFP